MLAISGLVNPLMTYSRISFSRRVREGIPPGLRVCMVIILNWSLSEASMYCLPMLTCSIASTRVLGSVFFRRYPRQPWSRRSLIWKLASRLVSTSMPMAGYFFEIILASSLPVLSGMQTSRSSTSGCCIAKPSSRSLASVCVFMISIFR